MLYWTLADLDGFLWTCTEHIGDRTKAPTPDRDPATGRTETIGGYTPSLALRHLRNVHPSALAVWRWCGRWLWI
jgi:hypothetical protein